MANLFKSEIASVTPEWTGGHPAHVKAFFTERTGGISSGPWGGPDGIMGMNVARHTGDFAMCVEQNRRMLAQCLPAEPKWLTQVHGVKVLRADRAAGEPEADASYTTTPGVVCAVMTADCLPVLFADRRGRIVGAAHAGWPGLAAGVLQETVRAMRKTLLDAGEAEPELAVWFGPRIGEEAFEVGEDVLDAMKTHLPEAQKAFRPAEAPGKYFADLGELARQALEQVGVPREAVSDCGLSTYADPKRFWSYRRDGARSGRHAALIWIEPEAH